MLQNKLMLNIYDNISKKVDLNMQTIVLNEHISPTMHTYMLIHFNACMLPPKMVAAEQTAQGIPVAFRSFSTLASHQRVRPEHSTFCAERQTAAARVMTQARNTPDALATSGNVREDHAFVPRDEGREADGGGWSARAP